MLAGHLHTCMCGQPRVAGSQLRRGGCGCEGPARMHPGRELWLWMDLMTGAALSCGCCVLSFFTTACLWPAAGGSWAAVCELRLSRSGMSVCGRVLYCCT